MKKIQSINPATLEVLKEFELLSLEEALNEIKKSKLAFGKWKNLSVKIRANYMKEVSKILLKNKKAYGKLITKEMGKPISSAFSEVEKCAWVCNYYARNASNFLKQDFVKTENKKSYVDFEPLGVILGIMPWNYPFWQVFRFAISTLCAGNAVIIKHASNVPQCALAIQEVFKKAGLPRGVFKVLLAGSQDVSALIEKVDGISITGSVEAGRKVGEAAGRNIKKVVLELGGSDPFIVLKDADIKFTCESGVKARMGNSGQSCIAAKRFIVVKEIASSFIKKFVEYTKALKIGDPMKKDTKIGPLARSDLVDNLDSQVSDAKAKGAKILCGGKKLGMGGNYYAPTVITDIEPGMRIYSEETFGPVASIFVVGNEEEAIRKANATSFGLGASIWTKDLKKGENIARQIQAGTIFVNEIVHSDPRLPFGGMKDSGFGRELGSYGIREFTNAKTIVIGR